ncbi:hypothetical protein HBN50_13600 [Halobacteriovorax sp. GB3]|uniref:hypothetical protein n=1 Tax=Halobacteriovorax sp. GB3 TaxID=2719615 RepID=UPI00235DFBD4|nr:hypothetical protein [Halobacteriovorax sp. GB3]MDD0854142.1 hypothetical protein [Halobacteriovorax sp. GB3]
MKELNTLLLFTVSALVYAQTDINVSSKLDVASLDVTTVKKSYCIFSDGDSSTSVDSLSSKYSGESGDYQQVYSAHGKTYLRKNIQWNSQTSEDSFKLSFLSSKSKFSDTQNLQDSHCTYRYRKVSLANSSTVLSGNASFSVPKGVWLIRVKTDDKFSNKPFSYSLSQSDYKDDFLEEVDFYTYSRVTYSNEMYFIINASVENIDQLVKLNFKYESTSSAELDLDFNFKVDFISANECLSTLDNKKISDIFATHEKIEKSLVGASCMLNTAYVKHFLSSIHVYKIKDFFEELDAANLRIKKSISFNHQNRDFERYQLFANLLDRIKFYYSYEILKESYSMMTNYIDYDGHQIDQLLYIDILRRRGVLYLFDVFDFLIKKIEEIENRTAVTRLDEDTKKLLRVYYSILLKKESELFEQSHELIRPPTFLSSYYLSNITSSAKIFSSKFEALIRKMNDIRTNDFILTSSLKNIVEDHRDLVNALRVYDLEYERFYDEVPKFDNYVELRVNLLAELEAIYRVNIESMLLNVSHYYRKHFEDSDFKRIVVGGKTFATIDEFISSYDELVKELRNE